MPDIPSGTLVKNHAVVDSVLHDLWAVAYKKCIPLTVSFEITLRCNIKCAHCYNFDRDIPYPRTSQDNELTPQEILDIIDQLREAGCLYLSFTGGEALVHPEIFTFVKHAVDKKMVTILRSNGTLLLTENVRRLVDAGATQVEISLHGACAKTHDDFVGIVGSFDRAVAGARLAKEMGLMVKFAFNLMKTNTDEIEDMIKLSHDLGVNYTIDPHITARYDGTRSSLDLRVDREKLYQLYTGPLASMIPEPDCNPNRSVQCSCARAVCGISANGDVYPCIAAPIKCGNLREKSFKEIWQNSEELNRIRGLVLDDFKVCKPCPDRAFCRRSSGVVYVNTGNYTGPEEWICMEANLLHKIHDEIKLPAAKHEASL